MNLSQVQVIEFFHLAFLDALSRRLDPGRYILKGGANLRYFFGSPRYSEDIDLDLNGGEPWGLEDKVDGVIESPAIGALLRIGGLSVADLSKPKQTRTTRRWKVAIEAPGQPNPVRTKIEFSNCNGDSRHALDVLPGSVVAPYALRSPSVQHYVGDAPTEQKVKALVWRSETQARDVFDLDLLLRQNSLPGGALDSQLLGEAAEIVLAMPFDAFRDQVLPFLESGTVELYDTVGAWEQLTLFVAAKLEEAR